MISNLLKRIVYSSAPLVTLYDKFVDIDTKLSNLEGASARAGRGAIGEAFFYDGLIPPTGALIADTSAIPRATYPQLMDALAPVLTCVITNGSNQVTGVSASIIAQLGGAGAKSPQIPVEGVGLPVGCKIASIAGTTITLSANANAAGTSMRIFIHGNGDGNTTFNLPSGADFWRGKDVSNIKDAGRVQGGLQVQQSVDHNHSNSPTFSTAGTGGGAVNVQTGVGVTGNVATGGFGSENRPANVSKLPCIWAL